MICSAITRSRVIAFGIGSVQTWDTTGYSKFAISPIRRLNERRQHARRRPMKFLSGTARKRQGDRVTYVAVRRLTDPSGPLPDPLFDRFWIVRKGKKDVRLVERAD